MTIRTVLLLLLFAGQLLAAGGFWQQVITTEKRFYTQPAPSAEANTSATAESTDDVDARFDAFNALVSALKTDPYGVENPQNPFFRAAEADEQLSRLAAKIRINREHGYALAETRDRIAAQTLRLQQRIFVFFASLAAEWTDLSEETLAKKLQAELSALDRIDLAAYEREAGQTEGGVSDTLAANLSELRTNDAFYRDFLGYLQLNPGLLHYRSLTQQLQLGSIIAAINNNSVSAKINTLLRYVGTDTGRLALFAGSLLLAWAVALLLFFRIYRLMVALITRKEDALDEMMLHNIKNIRRPLFIVILAFGLELGLDILRYPLPSEAQSGNVFFFIYVVMFSYILMILLDNFFYHYLLKQAALKNRRMRSELVNLILSIIRIVIFITALLFFLVHIGINITGLIASLGIGGLAVALAAKDTLSNFFGLLKILSDNSFSQGDWIQAGDVEGTVVEIGFISTDVRTFDNALITIPNEKLANAPLKNWNRRTVGRRIFMHVGVTYGSDRAQLAKAIDAIREMLYTHPDTVVPDETDDALYAKLHKQEKRLISVDDKFGIKNTLMVHLDQLSASSMDILIYTFTKTVNWAEWLAIKEDVIFKIWEILDAHGLEFAFPSQSLYFDKDNLHEAVAPVLKSSAQNPAAQTKE
jgi:MscS family membrane protein